MYVNTSFVQTLATMVNTYFTHNFSHYNQYIYKTNTIC